MPGPDRRQQLRTFLNHLKAGRKQEANALLAEIIAADPNQAAPYALLIGGMLAQNSQFRDALPLYQEAIRVNPGDPVAYFYLGVAYHALADYDTCERTWDRLAAEFPHHYLNHLQQALRALKQNAYGEATLALERAIEIAEPQNPMRDNAAQLLALVQQELKRSERAAD